MAKLYFYYSAMNAGKTTTLLQSAHNYRERGMRVAILTPKLDFRAGSGTVASRIGLRAEGMAFERDDDLEQPGSRRHRRARQARLRAGGRSAVPHPAQVWQLSEVVDALAHPGAVLRPAHRFPRRVVRGQPVPAGLGRRTHRDQDHLPQRQEGDDDRARG
jgi:hypothetical protein